jgi:hypothetical protein
MNPLPAGTRLEEYRIDKVLGTGTFGITYKAWDSYLDMPVAVKEFFPRNLARRLPDGWVAPTSPDNAVAFQWVMSRFVGEGQILARFRHPNIVRVWRYLTGNGTAYVVMDFEEGQSLADHLLSVHRPLEEVELRRIFVPVLEGLREVHRKRYLHRDIKPGNLFLRSDGPPCLLDFGAADLETAGVRDSANVLTHGYAPVEQYARRGVLSPASDLYALGASMYRCIAARLPPDSRTRLKAHGEGRPDPMEPAVAIGRGRYTRDLLELIDWMVAVAQTERPQSVDRVLAHLGVRRVLPGTPTVSAEGGSLFLHHRLLVTGAEGAGVRTCVATLTDGAGTTQDARAAFGAGAPDGQKVTWGALPLSQTERISLVGLRLPEQAAVLEAALQRGALGVLLLVSNASPDPLRDLDAGLRWLDRLPAGARMAAGITHADQAPRPRVTDYHARLQARGAAPAARSLPLLEIDPRSPRDVALLVQSLLYSIDPGADPSA